MPNDIPPHVEAFILRHLRSIAHLESLLWLREYRSRWWNADSLSTSVGISPAVAEKILEELCSGSLLAVQVSSTVVYQFSPATAEFDALVNEFIDVLRQSRVEVYGLIASPAARSVRDFADAFRFRDKWRG